MQQAFTTIQAIIAIIVILLIFFLMSLPFIVIAKAVFGTGKKTTNKQTYKYLRKDHIMTKREEKFFKTLCSIFEKKCYIIPQVHLSAFLEHRIKGQDWQDAFRHINGKSVDYVLLRRSDLSILCLVELDDTTHDNMPRIERDMEVERIMSQVGFPLVRIREPENMSKQDIVDRFADYIKKTAN